MRKSCREDGVTYQNNGPEAVNLGEGDSPDPKYDHLGVSALFLLFGYDKTKIPADRGCAPKFLLPLYTRRRL
jgi:hypothetical protein